MRYLIDTNIFLWSLNDDKKLKDEIKDVLKDPQNQIFVSIASAWEIGIKSRAGKLPLKTTLKRCFDISPFETLNIGLSHVFELEKLTLYRSHKDPFDKILIAQARVENLTFITTDEKIWKYDLRLLKA